MFARLGMWRQSWVFGAWGEASLEIHGLVQGLAKARMAILDWQPGFHGLVKISKAKLASFVYWVGRQQQGRAK